MKQKINQYRNPLIFIALGMLFFEIISLVPFAISAPRATLSILMCLLFLGLAKLFARQEGLQLKDVNLWPDMHTPARLALGFGMGAGIVGVMLMALFNLTAVDYEPVVGQSPLPFVLSSLVIIPLALMEEILFRSYPFFRMLKKVNVRMVIFITAVLFGLYHLNDETTIIGVLLGPGIWGVVYGVAAYLSKSVAVPLGIHVAANFMQGVFGMNSHVDSMLMINLVESNSVIMDAEVLGVGMQIVILITAIFILENHLHQNKQKVSYRS